MVLCVCVCVFGSESVRGIFSNHNINEKENLSGWWWKGEVQGEKTQGNGFGHKCLCRIERRVKEPKYDKWSKGEREEEGQQIIKQKETLLGAVYRSNIHWLIVSVCHTELIPGDLECVCWGGIRVSAVVRIEGHALLLDTLQQSHIVKPLQLQGSASILCEFFCHSTPFWVYDPICLGTRESKAMIF